MKLTNKLNDNSKVGEVRTPLELVIDMIRKIPTYKLQNPNTTYLIPGFGNGIFMSALARILVEEFGFNINDVKQRIVGVEINPKFMYDMQLKGYRVYNLDFLNEDFNMKFDVIIGNPPYQEKVGPNKTEPLWNKFVKKAIKLCNTNGYVAMIHPSGWRNIEGKFKDIQKLILSKKVYFLSIHNEKDGLETFGAETRYDYYVLQNVDSDGSETTVRFQDGQVKSMVLDNMDFIPNGGIDLLNSLLAKEGEDTVELLYSRSGYGTDKVHTSKEQNDEFTHPVVYTVNYLSQPTFYYSSINQNGHFGKSKVIWSNGRISSIGNYVDETGEYGLTQFAYAIADDVENLENIKKALDSKKFKDFMELCAVGQLTVNHKIVSKFKKDFWKEFIND